jgi:pantetheine-phosphate adenylyltransferase
VRDPHHKRTMFTVEERVAFLEDALAGVENVVVDVFAELVVDFARRHGARTMVKGLRVLADFEWEVQMNRLNTLLAPEIETMYVMSGPDYAFVSSSGVKEIASFGGKVDPLVPAAVAARFRELFPDGRPGAPLSPQE